MWVPRSGSRGLTLIELMVVMLIIGLLVSVLIGINATRSRARAQYTGCVSNVRNISTAIQMYANENYGRYPTTLSSISEMVGGRAYMKTIPTCPSAGADTYTVGYTYSTNPDNFTVYCSGQYHKTLGKAPNHPQYDNIQGLIEQ